MLLGMLIQLREMTRADWPSVERIYAQGIEDGEATFEVAPADVVLLPSGDA